MNDVTNLLRPNPAAAESDEIISLANPQMQSGWDQLARHLPFYVSADWLHYSDRAGAAESRYVGVRQGDKLLAAVSTHWAPDEPSEEYIARKIVSAPEGIGTVLTLGGRRGYVSAVLTASELSAGEEARALGSALSAAVAGVPETDGQWWWPYLHTCDLKRVLHAAATAGYADASVHFIGADCTIDIVGASIDAYIAALPAAQRRTNFRRERRRFTEAGLRIEEIPLANHWYELGPLLANVQRKYGHDHTDEQMRNVLQAQAESLGGRAVVFACFQGESITGFSLCYRWNDELALRVVGFDYTKIQNVDEYAMVAIHAPLDYCYRLGLKRLHLGVDSYESKLRRGAYLQPLWAVTSWPDFDPAIQASRENHLLSQLPKSEAQTFQQLVQQERAMPSVLIQQDV
ncbi:MULTISPECIES: GNAT family N-acetyltransferase [Aeromonas]|uniref:GNAT family N-acetyltransferase n=1 Tax=Aeromonas TaxID=642 RepID=UPI001933A938|nr:MULTISPECIES: GNAT family N-acetyltransferase [Aeromonas]MBM0419443.1 GNAT family N-acetyltransferase [Aeromonas veronii]MBW3791234.1 GNAT family N-acetyltransferase [Aeromonas veronii]UXB10079.1 GNAT family N-acetyltransferase [Aeromonas dhakensis]